MSDPFIGEIRIFAGTFAPTGWAFCNGQLINISANTALFSILGTTYGGNGTSNFAVPDLRGRVPMQAGQGSGLSNRTLGESGGNETVVLNSSKIPAHSHTLPVSVDPGTSPSPTGHYLAPSAARNVGYAATFDTTLATATAATATAHTNLQPYLTLNFIIALTGIFPPRS